MCVYIRVRVRVKKFKAKMYIVQQRIGSMRDRLPLCVVFFPLSTVVQVLRQLESKSAHRKKNIFPFTEPIVSRCVEKFM